MEDTPLGTGGAIQLALKHAQESSVLILNGDTYLNARYSLMLSHHLNAHSPMTMAVTRVGDISRYGGVVIESGRVSSFLEKGNAGPGWINAGAYVLERNFPWPAQAASRFSFETDVLAPFVGQIRPAAFPCEGYFLDIGIPEDLDRAELELSSKRTID
jgi:D-glycero-alpha-D-manno-heptose 1-phosphate guanylyltransferase